MFLEGWGLEATILHELHSVYLFDRSGLSRALAPKKVTPVLA